MPRITVTIPDALDEYLEGESGDSGEFESKSEVMRHLRPAGARGRGPPGAYRRTGGRPACCSRGA